jgi:hypothetical protein
VSGGHRAKKLLKIGLPEAGSAEVALLFAMPMRILLAID